MLLQAGDSNQKSARSTGAQALDAQGNRVMEKEAVTAMPSNIRHTKLKESGSGCRGKDWMKKGSG
jgi:hypothetical protein